MNRIEAEGVVNRDWKAVADLKSRYWIERLRRLGPAEGIRIADELRRQVVLMKPGWPPDEDRRKDLETHVKVAEALRRAGPPRRG